MAIKESHIREGDMAADTPQDMSLEQQKLVRALVKALDPIAARLGRVPLKFCEMQINLIASA
jgi:hypothetical protein